MIKQFSLSLILSCLFAVSLQAEDAGGMRLIESQRIWDKAPHSAFTDLIRFQDRWYCVFREGDGHVSANGSLRVLTSEDGEKWTSAALLSSEDSDLRDAKIVVTPDGRLMLSGAEAMNNPKSYKHQSLVWFSEDGKNWSRGYEVGDRNNWLWRVTWQKDAAYGFGYDTGKDRQGLRFFRSTDGKEFDTLISKVAVEGTYPNETSVVFTPDGTGYCLLRQDGQPKVGYIGKSHPPYTEWDWKPLDRRIGGPHMIRLPDGRFIAAVRLYDGKVRTSLCWLDPENAKITEALKLPSGGDTSYAGLVWHDDQLWVSYYSSHEGKTAIYLAKVEVDPK